MTGVAIASYLTRPYLQLGTSRQTEYFLISEDTTDRESEHFFDFLTLENLTYQGTHRHTEHLKMYSVC